MAGKVLDTFKIRGFVDNELYNGQIYILWQENKTYNEEDLLGRQPLGEGDIYLTMTFGGRQTSFGNYLQLKITFGERRL